MSFTKAINYIGILVQLVLKLVNIREKIAHLNIILSWGKIAYDKINLTLLLCMKSFLIKLFK